MIKYTDYESLDEFVGAIRDCTRESTLMLGIRAILVARDPSDGSLRYKISHEFNRGYDIARLTNGYDNVLVESEKKLKEWKKEECELIQRMLEEMEVRSEMVADELLFIGPVD